MARRAVINGAGKPLRLEDFEVPKTPADHIRVRVAYGGVCHSDVHLRNDSAASGFTLEKILGTELFNTIVLGHEVSGYVDDIGSGLAVTDIPLKKGDRVVVYPWLGCQKCRACQIDRNNTCIDEGMALHCIGVDPKKPGGYQTHITVDPKFAVKLPESIPLDMGCLLACSGGTAIHAAKKLAENVEFGCATSENGKARILIVGAGGLGLWGTKLTRVLYGDKVEIIVADLEQSKLDLAKKYGADEGVLWSRSSSEEENAAAVTSKGAIHGAIDFVGFSTTSSTAVKCMVRNGMLVIIGLGGGILSLPTPLIALKQISVRGCTVFDMQHLRELICLVEKHKITYPDIQHYSLDEANTALDALEKGQITGRAVVKHE